MRASIRQGIRAHKVVRPTVLFKYAFSSNPSTPTWTVANGSFQSGSGGNARNGNSTGFPSDAHAHKTISPAQPVLAAGIAMRTYSTSTPYNWTADTDADDFGLMSFCGDSGATCHIYLDWASNFIQARLGQRGTVLATASVATPNTVVGQFVYFEAEVKVDDVAGYVKVWQDNVLVINYTGDTRNGGTSTNLDTVKMGGFWPMNNWLDDFYIAAGRYGDPGDVNLLP